MNKDYAKEIEKIFRLSNSPSELFEAFHFALSNRISNVDLYKILIANPVLNKDEVKMFTEKLCVVFKQHSYEILMWAANIFEHTITDLATLESAISFYNKALDSDPLNHEPLVKLLNLYNRDYKTPYNDTILNAVMDKLGEVKFKSKVYFALAKLYQEIGNRKQNVKYLSLAEKASKVENQ